MSCLFVSWGTWRHAYSTANSVFPLLIFDEKYISRKIIQSEFILKTKQTFISQKLYFHPGVLCSESSTLTLIPAACRVSFTDDVALMTPVFSSVFFHIGTIMTWKKINKYIFRNYSIQTNKIETLWKWIACQFRAGLCREEHTNKTATMQQRYVQFSFQTPQLDNHTYDQQKVSCSPKKWITISKIQDYTA